MVLPTRGPRRCPTAGIWGQPNVIAVTGTYLQPIVPAPLPAGTWRILADNGDDGQDVISEPFYVDPCTRRRLPTSFADAELEQWKAAARDGATGPASHAWRSTVHTQDAKDLVVARWHQDLRTFIVGQLQDSASVELDFDDAAVHAGSAMGLLRHVSCGAYLAYEDIVADPPDPDFEHVTEPQVASLPTSGLAAADEAVTAVEGLRANAVAQRVAAERHQGAAAGDDPGWAAFHATTMAETGFASGREARRAVEPLRAAALQLESDMSIQPASDADVERARDIQQRIAEDGFTAGERADLAALGVLPSELDELRRGDGRAAAAGRRRRPPGRRAARRGRRAGSRLVPRGGQLVRVRRVRPAGRRRRRQHRGAAAARDPRRHAARRATAAATTRRCRCGSRTRRAGTSAQASRTSCPRA